MTNGEQVCLPFLDTLTGLLPSLPSKHRTQRYD